MGRDLLTVGLCELGRDLISLIFCGLGPALYFIKWAKINLTNWANNVKVGLFIAWAPILFFLIPQIGPSTVLP
jgi:hypothetical protein